MHNNNIMHFSINDLNAYVICSKYSIPIFPYFITLNCAKKPILAVKISKSIYHIFWDSLPERRNVRSSKLRNFIIWHIKSRAVIGRCHWVIDCDWLLSLGDCCDWLLTWQDFPEMTAAISP